MTRQMRPGSGSPGRKAIPKAPAKKLGPALVKKTNGKVTAKGSPAIRKKTNY